MGMRLFSSSRSYESNPLNPNPSKFTIKQKYQQGKYWLSLIHYHGCTNYEGNKILVTCFDPSDRFSIDPHFSVSSGIIARFQPTQRGWIDGQNYLKYLNSRDRP